MYIERQLKKRVEKEQEKENMPRRAKKKIEMQMEMKNRIEILNQMTPSSQNTKQENMENHEKIINLTNLKYK